MRGMKRHFITLFLIIFLIQSFFGGTSLSTTKAAPGVWTVNLVNGSGVGIELGLDPGKVRLASDKKFLASFDGSAEGSKGETASYSNSPSFSADGMLAKEKSNLIRNFKQTPGGQAPVQFTISTDDGNEADNLAVAQIFEGSGETYENENYRMTAFVPSDSIDKSVGGTGNKLTPGELSSMAEIGHEIASHGKTHTMLTTGNTGFITYKSTAAQATASLTYEHEEPTETITFHYGATNVAVDISGRTVLGCIPGSTGCDAAYNTTGIINALVASNPTTDFVISTFKDYKNVTKENVLLNLINSDCTSLKGSSCNFKVNGYFTESQIEEEAALSKKEIEESVGVVNGKQYEVKTLSYPQNASDPITEKIISKYYLGARANTSSVFTYRPVFSESSNKMLSVQDPYDLSVYAGGGTSDQVARPGFDWYVGQAGHLELMDTVATKAKFRDNLLNTTGSNTQQWLNNRTWVHNFGHYLVDFDPNGTGQTTEAKEADARAFLKATLEEIKAINDEYGELIKVVTFKEGVEAVRSYGTTYYAPNGVYAAKKGVGQAIVQPLGKWGYRTAGEVPNYENTGQELATLPDGTDKDIWQISRTADTGKTNIYPYVSPSGSSYFNVALRDNAVYTFSGYFKSGDGTTFTVQPRPNGSTGNWDATSDGGNNVDTNWRRKILKYSFPASVASTDLMIELVFGSSKIVQVAGLQLEINDGPTDYISNATTKKTLLSYNAQNRINYDAGSASLWFKPTRSTDLRIFRPLFSSKGVRAYFDPTENKYILDNYDAATGYWRRLSSPAETFAANESIYLNFTWDNATGAQKIYKGFSEALSEIASGTVEGGWTSPNILSDDLLYVGSDGYGDADSHIDDFAIFGDAKTSEYISANLFNAGSKPALDNGYATSEYTTEIHDIGSLSHLNTLTWDATEAEGTNVKFQIRSSDTLEGIDSASWYGPTNGSDYYDSSGAAINSANEGDRYVQIKAVMETEYSDTTPVLNSITLGYDTDVTAPAISAGADKVANDEFTQIGTITDEDSGVDNNTISWSQASGPEGGTVTFGSANETTTKISADIEGTYTIRLSVSDNAANMSYDEMNLVWDVTSPTAAISYSSNYPVRIGGYLLITAEFSEPMSASSEVNIAISSANTQDATAMKRQDDSTTTYTYVHAVQLGDGAATITLSNGKDLAGNDVVPDPTSGATFVVDNTPPLLSINTYSDNIFTTARSVVISGGSSDALGSGIATIKINGILVDSVNGDFSVTLDNLSMGSNTVTVTATDKAGNYTTRALTIIRTALAAENNSSAASAQTAPAASTLTVIDNNAPTFSITDPSSGVSTQISPNSTSTFYTQYPTFHGHTVPYATVEIEIHSTPYTVETTADQNGDWEYKLTTPLDFGEHSIKITIKEKDTDKVLSENTYKVNIVENASVQETSTTQSSNNFIWIFIAAAIIAAMVIIWSKKRK